MISRTFTKNQITYVLEKKRVISIISSLGKYYNFIILKKILKKIFLHIIFSQIYVCGLSLLINIARASDTQYPAGFQSYKDDDATRRQS